MKPLTLTEIKELELEILCHLHDLCQKHGLRYYLSYGTLLGAVRHKGFIPWDDDVDIIMPRQDYDRLIEIMSLQENDQRYKVLAYPKSEGYYYTHAKVVDTTTSCVEKGLEPIRDMGLWVDIFPLDGMDKLRRFRGFVVYFLHKMKALSVNVHAPGRHFMGIPLWFVAWKMSRAIGYRRLLELINRVGNYKFDESKYISCLIEPDKFLGIYYPRVIFDGATLLAFEDKNFYVPMGFEEYLRLTYGDYRKLPPENQRIGHGFEVYRRLLS